MALVGRRWTRDHVDPGRLRGDARRRDREHAHRPRRAGPVDPAVGLGRDVLPPGGDLRRARLRLPDRPIRPQEAVHGHAGDLPRVHRRVRAGLGLPELRRLPLSRRVGHRRRVRGDQLGDRRVDPSSGPGPGCARDQRELVGRHSPCRLLLVRTPPEPRRVDRVAAWVLPGRDARPRDHRDPPLHPGKPAVATHAWARGRSRAGRGRDRSEGEAGASRAARARGRADRDRAARAPQLLRHRPLCDPELSAAGPLGALADDGPGVPLQRDLLHLHARALGVLWRQREDRAAVSDSVRGRQLPRPARARAAVRHPRPPRDDLVDVHRLRRASDRHRPAVRARRPQRERDDGRLVRDLLLCLGGRELCLPVGERAVPARGPRDGDLALLCPRDRVVRALPDLVRRPHREREPIERQHRLPARRRSHDYRRCDRDLPRRPRRAKGAGGRRVAVHGRPRTWAVRDRRSCVSELARRLEMTHLCQTKPVAGSPPWSRPKWMPRPSGPCASSPLSRSTRRLRRRRRIHASGGCGSSTASTESSPLSRSCSFFR